METHSHFLFLVRPGRRTKRVFWKLLNERDPPTLNTIAKIRLPPSLTNLTISQRLDEGGTAPLEPELFARSWSNSSAKMKGSLTLFLKQKMDFNWSCKALVLNCEVVGLNLVPSYLNDIWNWKAYFFIICKLCAAQNTVNYVIFIKHQPT